MSAEGISQVKQAMSAGQGGSEEGLALVLSWLRSADEARAELARLARAVASVEEEFLDRPVKQSDAWLGQLVERLDFVARKLRGGR